MDDIEAGKAAFLKLLGGLDPEVSAVIPVRATNDNFLISLSKGGGRVFITVSEDDLLDLPEDERVTSEVREQVEEALRGLGG